MKHRRFTFLILMIVLLMMKGCGSQNDGSSNPAGTTAGVLETGTASWYGEEFQGKRTASGDTFDMNKLTAAHKSLPFNTQVEVTNQENGRRITVLINDRGPFVEGRIIDLSKRAAIELGMLEKGTAEVSLKIVHHS